MIPRGWRLAKLRDVALIKRGAGSQYLTYVPSELNGIRLIRISDFLGDDPKYVNHTTEIARFILKSNDILIAGTGATAGIVFKIPPEYVGFAHSYNAPCIRMIGDACPLYITYYLDSNEVKRQQKKLFTGNAQPFLDTAAIGNLRILLPSRAEQTKIAEILTCWDKAIELVERLIEEKKSFKRAVVSRMIRRFNAEKLPEYALGDLFQGVERRSTTDGLPVLSITAGKGFVDQREKFSRVIAGDSLKRYIQLNRGEFAYNKGNSDRFPFGCIYRLREVDSGLVPFVYFCFSARDQRVNGEFFEHYLQAGVLDRQLNKAINSGVRNDGLMNLSRDDFFAVKIHLPPKNIQSSYGALLSKLSEEFALLSDYRQALIQQKRGLMQQLLTGKMRVRV